MIIIMLFVMSLSFSFNTYSNESLKVQLPWYPGMEYIELYYAQSKGEFKKNNIDIDIRSWSPGIDVIKEVLKGKVDIGIQDSIPIIQSLSDGKDLVSFYTLYQETPLSLVSLKKNKIESIKDFEGKTLTTHKGYEFYIDYLFSRYPELKNKIKVKYIDNPNIYIYDAISTEQADIGTIFETVQAPFFRLNNKDINLIRYRELGFNLVAHVFFSSRETYVKKSKTLKTFLSILHKTAKEIEQNPDEAVKYFIKEVIPCDKFREYKFNHPDQCKQYFTASLKTILSYRKIGEKIPNVVNTKKWQKMINDLYKNKFIKNRVDIKKHVSNEILKSLYE